MRGPSSRNPIGIVRFRGSRPPETGTLYAMELHGDEQLIWRGHPAARAQVTWYLQWGFLALLPLIITSILRWRDMGTGMDYWKWVVLSLVLLGLVVVIDIARRASIDYVVTTHRLRIRRGILSRREKSASVEKVQNINTNQSLIDRILGVGAVDFDTAGADINQADFVFSGIANPHELVRRLEERQIGAGPGRGL